MKIVCVCFHTHSPEKDWVFYRKDCVSDIVVCFKPLCVVPLEFRLKPLFFKEFSQVLHRISPLQKDTCIEEVWGFLTCRYVWRGVLLNCFDAWKAEESQQCS